MRSRTSNEHGSAVVVDTGTNSHTNNTIAALTDNTNVTCITKSDSIVVCRRCRYKVIVIVVIVIVVWNGIHHHYRSLEG